MSPVETVSFALSVLVVIYTVTDGKSNYLEGAMVSLSTTVLRATLLEIWQHTDAGGTVDRTLRYHCASILRHPERGVREGEFTGRPILRLFLKRNIDKSLMPRLQVIIFDGFFSSVAFLGQYLSGQSINRLFFLLFS